MEYNIIIVRISVYKIFVSLNSLITIYLEFAPIDHLREKRSVHQDLLIFFMRIIIFSSEYLMRPYCEFKKARWIFQYILSAI